jgi:hypothetical protein
MVKITAGGKTHNVTRKKVDKGAGKTGDIIVEQNSRSGKKERMNLTKLSGAKTVKQGVKDTKKFHREHPNIDKKK